MRGAGGKLLSLQPRSLSSRYLSAEKHSVLSFGSLLCWAVRLMLRFRRHGQLGGCQTAEDLKLLQALQP